MRAILGDGAVSCVANRSLVAAEEQLRRRSRAGLFTRQDALACGFSARTVERRIKSAAWVRVAGVAYSLAGSVPRLEDRDAPLRRATAAAMTWPDGVVALHDAARIHRLPVELDRTTHVLVSRYRGNQPGLTAHLSAVDSTEIVHFRWFTATNLRRTALDCLQHLDRSAAERLLAWLRTREILSVADIQEAVRTRRGRWHVSQLRELSEMAAGGALNGGERKLHDLLHAAGLVGWQADQPVVADGQIVARVDILFARERVIVELDGRAFHQDFQRDRERLNRLTLAGYTVLRFTWHDVTERPRHVVAQIRQALQRAATPSA